MIMPSADFNPLSDQDVGAIIAYIKSLPAVTRELPTTQLHFLGRALWTAGQLPLLDAARIDHTKPHPTQVAMATGAEYGHYLADVGGCTGCHGPGLSGGKIPGGPPDWPAAANLTPGEGTVMGRYADATAFATMFKTGKRPDGATVRVMPFESLRELSDVDVQALHLFLKSLPARSAGNR
jgi:mono/diheme cytochrome c family protein